MKKKLISIIMSTFMTVSMFSTGYCTNAKAETINSEESSQETNAISASEITSISSVDNSATKYFPEILTQLGNSCQSYSMGYYVMTYEYNRLHNTSASLPENIMSPSWLYNLVNGGKIQGATFNSVIEVLKRNGIVSIKDVPIESIENYPEDDDPYYFDFHTTGNIWRKALDNRIKDSFNIKINNSTNTPITSEKDADLNEVKKSLAEGHIMSFSGHHGGYKFDTVDGPICKGQKIVTSDEGTSGIAHAMTVVGYNDDIWVDINNNGRIDDGEKGAFRVADSYTGSGDNGFFWLAYDALNKTSCVKSATNAPKRSSAVSSEGFYGLILGDTSNDEAVYLEFTVNSSNRNEVEFKVTDTDENAEFTTKIYGLSSGAYSYAGTTTAADGKFVLDLSKYNSKFTREKILNDGIKFTISDTKYNYKNTIVKEVYLYDKATNTRIQLNDRYVYLDNESIELSSKGNNYTTIFYKGLTTPYIHYKVGNGQWTKAPGEKIGESNKIYGYYYAIKINLGNEDTLTACFNDGNGNWDNNDKKNYTFGTGCYTFNCGKITEVSDPDYGVLVTDLEANIPGSIVEGNTVIFNTKTKNARGTVKYKYVLTRPDGTQSVLRDYSTYNSISWLTSTPGMYTVTAYANDGVSTSFKSINYEVKGFKNVSVSSLTSSLGTEFSLGKTTTISMKAQDGYSSSYSYSIKVNGKEILSNSNQTSASFKPTEAGTYTVVATVIDARGQRATKTITLRVNEVASNQTTIYYKGYSNPYIHYKVGNGSWTNAPGVKMSSNSDVNGYDYAITIDLGDAEKLTACFNNGSGAWDSNNGSNYTFSTGYYTFSNGKITKIDKPSKELKINSITCSSGSTIKMGSTVTLTVNASGGEGPYTYYLYYYGYGSGRLNYRLKGTSTNTATFTPDYPRDTTLYAEVVDSTGKKVTYSQVFNVKEITSNQTTIYYKGYDNAYIHYKIGNGSWTNAPGVKMESTSEKPGYTHKIILDLGDAEKLTACFNNGGSQWDNNGGKDYTFGVGTYTMSNGVITKIN